MHLLLVPSWYPRSSNDISGSFFREQAIALKNFGHQVGVIAPKVASLRSPASIINVVLPPAFAVDEGVLTHRNYGVNWLPRVPNISASLWIKRGLSLFRRYVERHGRPDILHAHCLLNGGLLAHAISMQTGIPYVITEHSTTFERNLVRNWQLKLAQRAIDDAAFCIAVSDSLCALMRQTFPGDDSKWRTIPNIVSSHFLENPSSGALRQDRADFSFCNVSLLTPKKGIDLLLRAFAAAFDQDTTVRLYIGGTGPEESSLTRLSAELGLGERVSFLGSLSRADVAKLMNNCNAYVLASHVETFGVVLVEALATGMPVVATRCGGPESIVRPQDGILVEKNSVESLSAGLRQVKEEYSRFDQTEIRECCAFRFGDQRVAERLTELYDHALVMSAPGARV